MYTLNSIVFDEFFNYLDATVQLETQMGNGLLGLGDRADDTVFLRDGVYSMYNRDKAIQKTDPTLLGQNSFSTFPFYMGMLNDSSWLGVYHTNLGAQDWYLSHNKTTGEARVETYAQGSYPLRGGIYLIFGDSPDHVSSVL